MPVFFVRLYPVLMVIDLLSRLSKTQINIVSMFFPAELPPRELYATERVEAGGDMIRNCQNTLNGLRDTVIKKIPNY